MVELHRNRLWLHLEIGSCLMDKHIKKFMEQTIINLNKALTKDDADLTWAVLQNLQSVVGTYESVAHSQRTNKQKKGNKKYGTYQSEGNYRS